HDGEDRADEELHEERGRRADDRELQHDHRGEQRGDGGEDFAQSREKFGAHAGNIGRIAWRRSPGWGARLSARRSVAAAVAAGAAVAAVAGLPRADGTPQEEGDRAEHDGDDDDRIDAHPANPMARPTTMTR